MSESEVGQELTAVGAEIAMVIVEGKNTTHFSEETIARLKKGFCTKDMADIWRDFVGVVANPTLKNLNELTAKIYKISNGSVAEGEFYAWLNNVMSPPVVYLQMVQDGHMSQDEWSEELRLWKEKLPGL